ncbi:MAG: tripartite tricarboxylate transporter permease [Planctomycetales bacterium]|nr:tripartite tricarboxylate transporter permease [Planctomycetales bacterium]
MPYYSAFAELLTSPVMWMWLVLGTFLGIVIGAIPGLTGAMLIALTMPLTFGMEGGEALVLLIAMYVGSISGGLVTATLLRMPGTPASMMTTLDGYPMAQNGQPGRALGLGIGASLFGGLVSWCFLILLAEPLAEFSTHLGPFDMFSLVVTAMALIAAVSTESLPRGLLAGTMGIFASLPGTAPNAEVRLTGGWPEMANGFQLLPVLIGLFAVSQVLREAGRDPRQVKPIVVDGPISVPWREWMDSKVNLIRSSLIGTWIGILPGIGANIGSVVAYTAARRSSKKPALFGHGSEEGIIASEAANNATVGGALIPLVAMGIPGSVIDAILLGALMLHGMQPGPLLLRDSPRIVGLIVATTLISNLVMWGLMRATARWLAKLVNAPQPLLAPTVLACCVLGALAKDNRYFDVWVMLGAGVLGLVMERLRLPLAPFVIGFVLAPVAEKHIVAGLMIEGGSYLPLVTRPVSALFLALAVATLWWSGLAGLRRRLRG